MKNSIYIALFVLEIHFCACQNSTIYGINLFLITGNNITEAQNVSWNNIGDLLSKSDDYKSTKNSAVFIPGEQENLTAESVTDIINGYSKRRQDYNIFILNWSPYSMLDYVQAARSIPEISKFVAQNFDKMRMIGFRLENFHLIGFGLGSQLAAHIGRVMKESYNFAVPRITGLNPSRLMFFPQFSYFPFIMKPLGRDDASFVDIIHTDGYLPGQATGDVNFYPNGGTRQPGCSNNVCNHSRAYKFYAESVTYERSDKKFISIKCQDYKLFLKVLCTGTPVYNFMGIYANPNATGSFFLKTNSQPPFSL